VTAVADGCAAAAARVTAAVDGGADDWDRAGRIPRPVVRELAAHGLLCADVPGELGGPGMTMADLGELTAHAGTLCSSLRSLMTSQGMVAWAVRKLGDPAQRQRYVRALATGATAAVAFSEAGAGSDLSAMSTTVTPVGDRVEVSGTKVWVTGAAYADHVLVFGRCGDGGAAVVVPVNAPRVTVTRVADPLGCRAAGHAEVRLDRVSLPAAEHLLGGAGMPLEWLVTSVLTYGRLSVAWGCVGMLRACVAAAARHASTREQFGKPLAEHQLVARHIAELYVAEQAVSRLCEHAASSWDAGSPEHIVAAVAAKHGAATAAARAAPSAVQVLASAGATDGHVVARAYRDAKLMEIIEGSSEISQLLLARHALARWT
jgi:methoxymalonate biosynthesis protein